MYNKKNFFYRSSEKIAYTGHDSAVTYMLIPPTTVLKIILTTHTSGPTRQCKCTNKG